jgi:hypothetical protein
MDDKTLGDYFKHALCSENDCKDLRILFYELIPFS